MEHWILDTGHRRLDIALVRILDTGYWILDSGYWTLDAGHGHWVMLDTGHWTTWTPGTGCWVLGADIMGGWVWLLDASSNSSIYSSKYLL